MVQWIKNICERLMGYERSVRIFTLSSCLGIYIAFSPFIGFHTMLVFFLSWLFAWNVSVVLAVSMMINNPWTMVPVYALSHLVGDKILSFLGCNHYAWNPVWVMRGNEFMSHYLGFSGFSFWAFMIGGNVLGLALALCAYPLIKTIATLVALNKQTVTERMLASKMMHSVALKAEQVKVLAKTNRKEHAARGSE